MSKHLTKAQSQSELVDAIADETTHLRAELNAIKAELQALREAYPPGRESVSPPSARRSFSSLAQRVQFG